MVGVASIFAAACAQTPVSELEDLRDVLREWQEARLPLDGTNWFPAGDFVLASADGGLGAVAEGAVPSPEGCWRLYVTEDSQTGETLVSDALGFPLATLPGDGPSADQGGPWDPSRVGICLDFFSTNMSTTVEIPTQMSRTGGVRKAISTLSAGDLDSSGDGVVLYYDFDVVPEDGMVPDRSGSGHDGAATGCEWTVGGRFNGGAMVFDDNEDSINVGTGLDFPTWSQYSVSIWFRHDGGGDMGPQYGHKMLDKTEWYHDWHLHLSPPDQEGGGSTGGIGLAIYEAGVGGGLGDSSMNYADNAWHHVVVVRDGGHGEFWVDGVLRDQTEGMFSVYSTSPLCVGNSYSGDYYQRKAWHGSLDEVRVFDRPLSSAEIQALRLAGALLDPAGDEDGDGLPNGRELDLGTNPFLADTDGDGYDDDEEIVAGQNPLEFTEGAGTTIRYHYDDDDRLLGSYSGSGLGASTSILTSAGNPSSLHERSAR